MRPARSRGLWLDRGLRAGAEHVALDAALLKGASRPTLHLHRYLPTASLGRYEAAEHAIRADYCRGNGIEVVRRVAGGHAMFLDPAQQCWALAFPAGSSPHDEPLVSAARRHAAALVCALRGLGVVARYAPPGDIEVDGRKLATVIATRSASGTLLLGTLWLDIDVARMLRVLRVPIEKLSPQGVQSARQRFVTLRELSQDALPSVQLRSALLAALGEAFKLSWELAGITDRVAPPSLDVRSAAAPLVASGAVRTFTVTPGGVLHAWMRFDDAERAIVDAGLSGSVQCSPPSLLTNLGTALQGPVKGWRERLRATLAGMRWEAVGFGAADFETVCGQTLARLTQQRTFGLLCDEANTIMLCDEAGLGATEILRRATVMLVPYCAKLVTCKWRHRDGCPECGLCEVGDAYRLARTRGMRVTSITNYEHLQSALTDMRARRVGAYVGMCCKEFFLKRHYAFRVAGIPGVLLDISGANCYELHQEDVAYAGRFSAQATLNGAVMEKVMRFVPPRARDSVGD